MVGQVVVVQDALEAAFEEECVSGWLLGLGKDAQSTYRSFFRVWLLWLWKQPGWESKRPSELLDFQENATGRKRKLLLGLMQDLIQMKGGTYIMIVRLSHLRSFFLNNGVDMPTATGWNPEPTREPVQGKLTLDQVREIILHSKLREQALFLTMLQGMMDLKRFHVPIAVLARVILGQYLKTGYLMDSNDSNQLAADIRRLPETAKKLYVK